MTTDQPTVVSTTPSGTEILYALGVEPAAVSHACDYPPAVAEQPRINTSRVDAAGSAERDAQADGEVYDVDVALLRDVEPDLIVTQSVCGVCAVDESLVNEHLDDLATDPTVLSLRASDLAGVVDCIHEVGAAVGRPDRAADVAGDFEGRIDALRARTEVADARPSVAVLEWLDPLRGGANWVPELVTAAGGTYPLADSGDRSVDLSWAELRTIDPDVLVVAPCSFDVAETRQRTDKLRERPGWSELQAVQTERVYAFDGRLLNRWTPRLAEAADGLARTLHPNLFDGEPPLTPLV
jgi:iron complex transport system substrate-binding protein